MFVCFIFWVLFLLFFLAEKRKGPCSEEKKKKRCGVTLVNMLQKDDLLFI